MFVNLHCDFKAYIYWFLLVHKLFLWNFLKIVLYFKEYFREPRRCGCPICKWYNLLLPHFFYEWLICLFLSYIYSLSCILTRLLFKKVVLEEFIFGVLDLEKGYTTWKCLCPFVIFRSWQCLLSGHIADIAVL